MVFRSTFLLSLCLSYNVVAADQPTPTSTTPHASVTASTLSSQPVMVDIPAGVFEMGNAKGSRDERPAREVSITAFQMGLTEVTWEQYQACIDEGACEDNTEDGGDNGWGKGSRPVIEVNWEDTQFYITWLNKKTGKQFRLPTEAEWEYAARAGSQTIYSWGDELIPNRANCYSCGSEWDNNSTAPAGSFQANAFGLHDMQGNVWEWVQDCHHDNYKKAPKDGREWLTKNDIEDGCSERVKRGGSWFFIAVAMQSSYRSFSEDYKRNSTLGFRLAHDAEPISVTSVDN